MWVQSLRIGSVIAGVANFLVVILGGFLLLIAFPSCHSNKLLPILLASFAAAMKILIMIKTGFAQQAIAKTILESLSDTILRHQRRMRYKTWLWWTRFAIVIAVFQFVAATYLICNMAKLVADGDPSSNCVLGVTSSGIKWKQKLLLAYMIIVCFVALLQCFIGTDILRWRSFYASHDEVWKAHYEEVFDYGIREILCCFGRVEYLTTSDEDEVCSVARLLGDIVAYRASGTSHLQLLAGLALFQRHSQTPILHECSMEAPEERLQGAATFYKFAEAAYTGPLLDVGRNPIIFPCAWIYRQGVLTPWSRNSRPKLDGDNWWRGHAAAFLKYVNLSGDVLRRGRVCQDRCKAAYFILVLHHLRSVVITVRGTETPEDLITDGLGKECFLSTEDLDGLINSRHMHLDVKKSVESSFPHYGHSGIVEAARELFMQVEGNPIDNYYDSTGFLSSLLGAGCECDGYNVQIVGHSLGGAIAALLGIRLYGRFPNLHVYTFGPLPCVDSVVANACTEFVTSIVYNNEFSARLSVGSVLRLRASALMALSNDTRADTASIFSLAHQFLHMSKGEIGKVEAKDPAEYLSGISTTKDEHSCEGIEDTERDFSFWNEANSTEKAVETAEDFINPFHEDVADVNPFSDPVSHFMDAVSKSEDRAAGNATELFLPGLIIHIVPQRENLNVPLWKSWSIPKTIRVHKAFIANRESFTDIVVSPSMFLDHLPWRCYHAIQKVLEARSGQHVLDEPDII